jgi:hypothetical protein
MTRGIGDSIRSQTALVPLHRDYDRFKVSRRCLWGDLFARPPAGRRCHFFYSAPSPSQPVITSVQRDEGLFPPTIIGALPSLLQLFGHAKTARSASRIFLDPCHAGSSDFTTQLNTKTTFPRESCPDFFTSILHQYFFLVIFQCIRCLAHHLLLTRP